MNNAVQDIPDQEHNGTRNTGFPEPLSTERNTTLHHPSADTSPTASIEASDIPLNRTSSRLRFSRKHSKATSKGNLDPEHMYDNIVYEDGTVEPNSKPQTGNQLQVKDSSPETDSTGTNRKVSYERSSGEGGVRGSDGETGSQKKKRHFLRKLRKH